MTVSNPSRVPLWAGGRVGTAAVVVFMGLQALIPAALLGARWVNEGSMPWSEYRLSWQMFSAVDSGSYSGITDDGESVELDLEGLPPILRAVVYTDSTLRMLCDHHPQLESVSRKDAADLLESHEGAVEC